MSKQTVKRRIEGLEEQKGDNKIHVVICDSSGNEPKYSGDCWTQEDRALNRELSKAEFEAWENNLPSTTTLYILKIYANKPTSEN